MNYTYFAEIQESKTFTSNLHQKRHTEVFSNASFYKLMQSDNAVNKLAMKVVKNNKRFLVCWCLVV